MCEDLESRLDNLIEKCSQLLYMQKKTVAFAESVTGGFLSYRFMQTQNGGDIMKGGIVCYNAEIKHKLLGVSANVLKQYTPESPQVTQLITEHLKPLIKADYYIGITGLSKCGGSETEEKPVGTIFTYILGPKNKILNDRALFSGNENDILKNATENICRLLIFLLEQK